jgi:protein-disulfide isomerase
MDLKDTSTKIILIGVVVLIVLIVTGAVIWGGGTQPASGTPTTTINPSQVQTTGDPSVGSTTAPVTMVEFSDYQCPACKEFELTTLPQIMTNYVGTGKVKIVFKDFPFLGPDSMVDSEYARAILVLYPADFFAWRTAVYTQEPDENTLSATANQAFMATVLSSINGIDPSKVIAAVSANQSAYDATINADKAEGTALGVDATPTFVIGNQLISGAYPYATFTAALNPLLQQ